MENLRQGKKKSRAYLKKKQKQNYSTQGNGDDGFLVRNYEGQKAMEQYLSSSKRQELYLAFRILSQVKTSFRNEDKVKSTSNAEQPRQLTASYYNSLHTYHRLWQRSFTY